MNGHIILMEAAAEGVRGCVNIEFPGGHIGAEHDAVIVFIHNCHVAGPDL